MRARVMCARACACVCARVHACVRDTQRATTQRATWRRSVQVTDRAPYIGERASRCHERTIASVMGMEFRDMSGNVRHYKRADVAYAPRGHCRGVQPLPRERASERRTADSGQQGARRSQRGRYYCVQASLPAAHCVAI